MTSPGATEQISGVAFPVRIIESARRKKTVSAKIIDGVLDVRVPCGLPVTVRDDHIRRLATRLGRKRATADIDLEDRARKLASRFGLPTPDSIEWSARQNTRWGSCTPATGSVRISDRLTGVPLWVLDYVIVHELAHLEHLNHGPDFQALVARYPKAERAEGFLEAVALGHAQSARQV